MEQQHAVAPTPPEPPEPPKEREEFKCHIAYDLDIFSFNFNCCGSWVCVVVRVEWCIESKMKFCQEQKWREKKLETEKSNFRSIAFIAYLSSNGKYLSDSIPSEF